MSDLTTRKAAPILDIANVSKVFDRNGSSILALKDVNLQIQKGEFVCLIGASGCGKSTLLRIMGGFESASSGVARMYFAPIEEPSPERGMVFQDYGLFPWLTVRQNIAFGPKQRGLSEIQIREVSDHYLNMVGLDKFADYFPGQLSGGMKQRVSIARVLANDCEVLLMDEPFGALDALTRAHLQDALLRIVKRTQSTVVMVTHDVDEAVLLSDRIVMLTNGPAATIGQILAIQLPARRDRVALAADPRYLQYRAAVMKFLHQRYSNPEQGTRLALVEAEQAAQEQDSAVVA